MCSYSLDILHMTIKALPAFDYFVAKTYNFRNKTVLTQNFTFYLHVPTYFLSIFDLNTHDGDGEAMKRTEEKCFAPNNHPMKTLSTFKLNDYL